MAIVHTGLVTESDGHELDEYLDRVLIGGREEREVTIVDYDPSWVERFTEERSRIQRALGPSARSVEHIGSTAVPGLAAKPIVDIIVSVDDPNDERTYRTQLEEAGYVLRVREPDHRMFRTPERDVHIHIWRSGSDDERRHLIFRDWLRSHPADRADYERTKRMLAGNWPDMNYYANAKSEVINQIMDTATRNRSRTT